MKPEAAIQKAIAQYLTLRRLAFYSVPNEGHGGNPRRAMYLRSLGQRNGVADIVVMLPNRSLYLEVKSQRGSLTKSQRDFRDLCATLPGHDYYAVRSVDDVRKIVDRHVNIV